MDENRILLQNPHDTGLQYLCIQREYTPFPSDELINIRLEIAAIFDVAPLLLFPPGDERDFSS